MGVFVDAHPAQHTLLDALGDFSREEDIVFSLYVTATQLTVDFRGWVSHRVRLAFAERVNQRCRVN